jgi:hypothetical protein
VEKPLTARVDGNNLVVTLPELGPEEAPCRHAFALKIADAEALPEK